ncbi:uncharacterized protein MONBRDRAFT_27058 [Monosiga brevicollis MX1]|uniref:Gametogenetin-binding protein 2 n=1 Tax=Monosiga brevicollis TaxID=81824 RepID=A9V465_MONBE|nr:uncharacterized protein MONBRDRAFT_27058 [Monosiga brevicollis MX1]EDQ87565.1 predicted protein [Monosiga brevicollis MX1]|eukprot:XP_001747485.1 hypothetical protein [Monosiga brevicollis MX1]
MWQRFMSESSHNRELRVNKERLQHHVAHRVACIGCRRAIDHVFDTLSESIHQTLQPLHVSNDGSVSLHASIGNDPVEAFIHLHPFRNVTTQTSTAGKRCILHRASPQAALERLDEDAWQELWEKVPEKERELIMDFDDEEVEEAAQTHMKKFCLHCRREVEKAWEVLKQMEWFDSKTYLQDTGYDPIIFEGLSYDKEDRVLQVSCDSTYLCEVIAFARKDISDQERHAETQIKAQTEVVMIVGHLVRKRVGQLQWRLAIAEQQHSMAYALAASALWEMLEQDIVEREAEEAARSLLQLEEMEEATKSKSKKKKKKKNKAKNNDTEAQNNASAKNNQRPGQAAVSNQRAPSAASASADVTGAAAATKPAPDTKAEAGSASAATQPTATEDGAAQPLNTALNAHTATPDAPASTATHLATESRTEPTTDNALDWKPRLRETQLSEPKSLLDLAAVLDELDTVEDEDDAEMADEEFDLLKSMGWSGDTDTSVDDSCLADLSFDTLKAKQLDLRQQIRERFNQFVETGHLTFQCRNYIKVDDQHDVHLDVSSTSSEDSESELDSEGVGGRHSPSQRRRRHHRDSSRSHRDSDDSDDDDRRRSSSSRDRSERKSAKKEKKSKEKKSKSEKKSKKKKHKHRHSSRRDRDHDRR